MHTQLQYIKGTTLQEQCEKFDGHWIVSYTVPSDGERISVKSGFGCTQNGLIHCLMEIG